jgi:hypothetical protein
MARTEATVDRVYPGGPPGDGKTEAGVYDRLGQTPDREDMQIMN